VSVKCDEFGVGSACFVLKARLCLAYSEAEKIQVIVSFLVTKKRLYLQTILKAGAFLLA
jgi:hypothetical protein